MTAFCCTLGHAQIIYSNNFALGMGVSISNTAPTLANTYAGGTSGARWTDTIGQYNTAGVLLDNGVNLCAGGDYWCLPFKPTNGYVYLLTVNLTFTNGIAAQPEIGFSTGYSTNNSGVADGRFNGSVGGYDWMACAYASGNIQYFAGSKTANTILSQNGIFPANTASTNTFQILLDTRGVMAADGTNWSCVGTVNGMGAGNGFTYSGANPVLLSVGLTENSAPNPPSMVQFNLFTLTTTLQPFIFVQPVAATILGGGSLYTNLVRVLADTNGGTLAYQWYANNLPLVNGVNNVSGANTNVLVINPISSVNQFTNYYVVVTNNFGSCTSYFASLTVLTNPVVSVPVNSSNAIILFGGSGSYVGSSPFFSVTAIGAPPLTYQWLTNGVAIGGATNKNFTFAYLQANGPTNLSCVVSNSFSTTNVAWWVTYSNTPTAAYPQAVLMDLPLGFWRLNEADDGMGNLGAVCHDYQSGANGVYTNVNLGQSGYDALEPTETSMAVANAIGIPSCMKQVHVDLAATMTNTVNAAFAVEAWANCLSGNGFSGGAPVVSQGSNAACSFFLGVDTNTVTKRYQFYVRSAGGTVYLADATNSAVLVQADDLNWHYLVGVCDEVHTNISLYIDGNLAASSLIPAASGNYESGYPVAVGAGLRPGASDYGIPFTGNIDDVAIYSHALSAAQVIGHYTMAGNPYPVALVSPPPANFVYLTGATLTIPATVAGSGPVSYYWTNVTVGGAAIVSGGTNYMGEGLNVTLTISNAPASLSGDQLELVVAGPSSSTNVLVTLFSPAAPVTVDYSNTILYSNLFNGGAYSIAGLAPTVVNALVGGTNTTWMDAEGTNDPGLMPASGIDGSTAGNSWVLPFTPHAGYVYTISASATFLGNPGSWLAAGFCLDNVTNTTDGRFNGFLVGYDWTLFQYTGNAEFWRGPAAANPITNGTVYAASTPATHSIIVILDTTTNNWKASSYVDGVYMAATNYPSTNLPPINKVGIGQNTSQTAPYLAQWNTFMLTQVGAGGGLPPFAYNPAPPTNVTLLADAALSIPTTAFGSAPFGYYWMNTNTAAVLGSGVAGTTAPISANLEVADVPFSWNGNTLALVVTNAYGTNISYVSVTVTNAFIIPTNKPTITGFSFASGTNVTINATNGQSGGTYYLLGSTNLTTPLSQWLPLATNVILTNGGSANGFTFSGTNVIQVGNPQQFYILSNTN
jgi:hypothetical protein